ncbi:hypothetical protein COOONC_00363 [Cooperia oncophora]
MTSSDSEAEDDVYSLCVRDSPFCIDIALPEDRTSLRHISGFDNTGNVRIWPGGEALAYYLSIRPPLVSGKLVLELGAGLVGLPGFIAAIYATRVRITDGNEHSVASLRDIAKRNPLPNVEIEQLRWGVGTEERKFDLILAADCVFFSEYYGDLELQKSIQVSVLKSADDVCEEIRTQGGRVQFDPEVVAHVSALVWDTVSDEWTSDLLAFSRHGGRETVTVSDAALILRRNRRLLEALSATADIDIGEYERPLTKRQRVNKESKIKRGNRCEAGDGGQLSEVRSKPVLSSRAIGAKCEPENEEELALRNIDEGKAEGDIIVEEAPIAKPSTSNHKPADTEDDRKHFDEVTLFVNGHDDGVRASAQVTTSGEGAAGRENVCEASSYMGVCSPKASTTKSPSPDLFSTPLKRGLDEGSASVDHLDICAPTDPVSSCQALKPECNRESVKNIEARSRKVEEGWSAKFSEFSFFDNVTKDAPMSTCVKGGVIESTTFLEAPRKPSQRPPRELTSDRRSPIVSTTPKQNSSTTSRLRCARTPGSSGSGASKTPQERPKLPPPVSIHNTDSDDDFFDL